MITLSPGFYHLHWLQPLYGSINYDFKTNTRSRYKKLYRKVLNWYDDESNWVDADTFIKKRWTDIKEMPSEMIKTPHWLKSDTINKVKKLL